MLYDYPNGEPDELWLCRDGSEWDQISLSGSWFTESFSGPMNNLQRYEAGEDDFLYSSTEDSYETMALVEACFVSAMMPGQALVLDE